MNVKLNPEYEKIAKSFPMSKDEYEALKESIKKGGSLLSNHCKRRGGNSGRIS
jgi:hypothetical protein